MRGLPGSGKSTRAKGIAGRLAGWGLNVSIRSTDDQFMVEGEYRFDPKRLKQAHERNRDLVSLDMNRGVDVIILDNTNMQKWEFQDYVHMAEACKYPVRFVTVGDFTEEAAALYAERNTHGVPYDTILKMAQRFEP